MKHIWSARAPRIVAACLAAIGLMTTAQAEIVIGASFSATGPAAALGIAPRNTLQLFPEQIAGEKVRIVFLDDATDPSAAARNARRFVDEEKADVIIGSTASPAAIAIAEVANSSRTVQLAAAPIELPADRNDWVFRLPQGISLMAEGTVQHMKQSGVRTVAFLGYTDAYGESWLRDITRGANGAGLKVVAAERFSRADTSVTAQALKVLSVQPDAVLVVASGSGALMPQKALIDRGYKGKIYQTYSAVAQDLIRMGGKEVEGTLGLSGPAGAFDELADSHPSKRLAQDFQQRYEAKFGAGTYNQFAANVWCAKLMLDKVIPMALKKAKPGTPEFRAALREALETVGEVPVPQGVLNYTPKDHFGYDERARLPLIVQNGRWRATPASAR